MRKFLTLFVLSLAGLSVAMGQFTLTSGNHSLEISGFVSCYYNQRFLKPGESDMGKNRFKLRDAQLKFEGRFKDILEYELQVDLADLAASTSGVLDPENPGVMDANILFKGVPGVNIRVGYSKLPYSRSSLVPIGYSPYWQRAELGRGTLFSRRDAGVTLERSLWRDKIFLFAGIYTGTGELVMRGDNDPAGKPEYVVRGEFHWPCRYRYREIDFTHSPIPMFSLGLNARYTNRTLPQEKYFLSGETSDYGIKVIDGKKYTVGFDLSAQYQGFSAQVEAHRFYAVPADSNSGLFQGKPYSVTNGYFSLGTYLVQLNYYSKKLRSVFSARFEELNLSDLVPGSQKNISVAYNYVIKGGRSVVKLHYFHILSEETQLDPLKWKDQLRVGWQFNF